MNATDHAQQTALHWAAVRGSTSVADVLVEHGARVEAADVNGYRVMRRLCVSMDVQFGVPVLSVAPLLAWLLG